MRGGYKEDCGGKMSGELQQAKNGEQISCWGFFFM
jgi:hypothetical protein